jgi:hypothetical protein
VRFDQENFGDSPAGLFWSRLSSSSRIATYGVNRTWVRSELGAAQSNVEQASQQRTLNDVTFDHLILMWRQWIKKLKSYQSLLLFVSTKNFSRSQTLNKKCLRANLSKLNYWRFLLNRLSVFVVKSASIQSTPGTFRRKRPTNGSSSPQPPCVVTAPTMARWQT